MKAKRDYVSKVLEYHFKLCIDDISGHEKMVSLNNPQIQVANWHNFTQGMNAFDSSGKYDVRGRIYI